MGGKIDEGRNAKINATGSVYLFFLEKKPGYERWLAQCTSLHPLAAINGDCCLVKDPDAPSLIDGTAEPV